MSEWNGVPPNEEYRGWHWLYLYNSIPIPAYWDDHWLINGKHLKVEDLNPQIKYWERCLTPSEIEAKDARIAELEAALHKIADRTKRAHPQAQEGEIHQIAITALTKTQENINDINE